MYYIHLLTCYYVRMPDQSDSNKPFIMLLVGSCIALALTGLPCDNGPCRDGGTNIDIYYGIAIIFSLLGISSLGKSLFEKLGVMKFGSKNIVSVFIIFIILIFITVNVYSYSSKWGWDQLIQDLL